MSRASTVGKMTIIKQNGCEDNNIISKKIMQYYNYVILTFSTWTMCSIISSITFFDSSLFGKGAGPKGSECLLFIHGCFIKSAIVILSAGLGRRREHSRSLQSETLYSAVNNRFVAMIKRTIIIHDKYRLSPVKLNLQYLLSGSM